MVKYAPGGVMSVATANALKVEWPAVCPKGICQRLIVILLSIDDSDHRGMKGCLDSCYHEINERLASTIGKIDVAI